MNPDYLKHKAKFKLLDGCFYHLIKLDHPTLTLWILISEYGGHWCHAMPNPLNAFGNWENNFIFIQFDGEIL